MRGGKGLTAQVPPGDAEPGLRAFALEVYGCDGVPTAALLLQDRAGVDVNVMLLAAYVGSVLGRTFGAEDAAAAQDRIGAWQTDVVRPLRAVRSRLKDGPAPAPSAATSDLRNRIKAIELDAELIELDELSHLAEELPAVARERRESAARGMRAVIVHVASREPTHDESAAIDVIAAAASRYGERS